MRRKTTVWILVGAVIFLTLIVTSATVALHKDSNSKPKTSTSQKGAPPNVADTSTWAPVFSDEFTGNKLDVAKWATCYDKRPAGASGCTNSGNAEQEWYMPSQVTVKNGDAVLTAINDPISINTANGPQTFPYRSGMITTGRGYTGGEVRWSAKYGYFVARMKIDGGQGVWPAFWLLPTNRQWPPEIDIMEHLGDQPNKILLTTHWPSATGPQKDGSEILGPDYTQGWHTYAVNWQPGVINWYVDGKLQKTFTGNNVPNTPMEIIFDLAIGGYLPGKADSSTQFPRTALIDYVRVYERKATH